jgi:predicted enzyme related to lactoylglutathione lyase
MIFNEPKSFTTNYLDGKLKKRKQIMRVLKVNICSLKQPMKTEGPELGGGGMMKRQHPQQMICNFITISSIDSYSSKIEQLGGKILVPKTAAKGHGYFVVCSDTENNHFGIFEEDVNAK